MGAHAARKAATIVDHVATVLSIETICAAQALELRKPLTPARAIGSVLRSFRRRVPKLIQDRQLSLDIEKARTWLLEGSMRQAAAQRRSR